MKFSQIVKNQTVNYRLCDEFSCKSIAMRASDDTKNAKHLCETHYLRYKAELKDVKIYYSEFDKVKDELKSTPDQLTTLAKMQLKLNNLGIDGHFLPDVSVGPIVTLYKYIPTNATRVSAIEGRADDLAIALSVDCIQISRLSDSIGIFVPNKEKTVLQFKEAVTAVWTSKAKLPILLGMDHTGTIIVEDLATLPHLLIAGSTGGGKSTLLNSIISSLMYCKSSRDLKLVLCDTKQVEFTHFQKAPHLLFPVATSVRDVINQLELLVEEVESRLTFLAKRGKQNIAQNNEISQDANKLPYIILIIDELADPLQDPTKEEGPDGKPTKSYGKQAEYLLGKIVQKARATGIHVIAATQRTSVKVVEGNIKANFPARISFRLPSETDSRTILGSSGAEHLLSQGDMLYLSPSYPAIRRIHAPYASIEDIKMAVEMASKEKELNMADENFEKFEKCFITDSTDLENREYEEFSLADLVRVAGIVERAWTAAIASQREIGPCGKHPLECYAVPDEKWKQREHLHYIKDKRTILFCTICAELSAAYAKGALDALRKFRDAHNLGSEGYADVGSNFSERKLDEMIAALPIPAAQPRDLGKLRELVERWNNEKNTYIHYCADKLAAILKEMEGSR